MFYVYLLLSLKDFKWYTGYTDNLKRRFEEHYKGLVYSTRKRKPFKIIYYEACFDDDAKMREIYLKTGMGKRYFKNRLKFYINKHDKSLMGKMKMEYNSGAVNFR